MQLKISSVTKHYWSYIIVSTFILVLVWLFSEQFSEQTAEDLQQTNLIVSALTVVPNQTRVEVKSIGISIAHWRTDIVAGVSGRVAILNNKTIPGSMLLKNEIMIELKDSLYQAEQKSALARVAQAELALAKIKNEQFVANKVANGKSKTTYGQLTPHLKSAKADLVAAQTANKNSLEQLNETSVKAPFNAIVLERRVTPGQWINTGDILFSLANSESIDIQVALSAIDWKRIGTLSKKSQIKIVTPSGKQWVAAYKYLSPVLDIKTRQRNITLEVTAPYLSDKPLLAGQQVDVIFEGPVQNNIVKAPASVLTEDGKVWSIQNALLVLEDIELLDEQSDNILYRYHKQPGHSRSLVRYPLSTMLEGQKVQTKLIEETL